jgi:hypothetical protein
LTAKIHYWDVFLSSLLHQHETLVLTVLLFLPAMLFSPTLIALPILAILRLNGWEYTVLYIAAIALGLFVSTTLKKHLGRSRPKARQGLLLKPMYFRSKESNNSMPSGDSVQAGCFVIFYFLGTEQCN